MDDARIQELTAEVLAHLRGGTGAAPATAATSSGLEGRVAALERAVASLSAGNGPVAFPAPAPRVHVHPSLQLLQVTSVGGGQCVLEPDKPCVGSGQCRTLGH